ncbi:hypothetical protein SAMN04488029_2593 [Reichenbachiella faecimaris]|uniref:Uncharacterized protein n=1 Tax=Reichenbachiella faecimaris TaxID=692418 RepID=A0A1W2GH82_REIFA|nr:hypothetical protein [Reichenbachiella faecimaris]SMD35894.1 hypothetical protein SAMN04488029_2593 [Reichenbachiella faecimaris]
MSSENTNKATTWRPFIIWGLLITLIWFCYHFGINYFYPDPAISGQFGDKYGALNTLFSGLAFAAFIYTIHLQREDLRLTRTELQKSADAHQKTVEHLETQRMENTEMQRISILPEWRLSSDPKNHHINQLSIELTLIRANCRYKAFESDDFQPIQLPFWERSFMKDEKLNGVISSKKSFKEMRNLNGATFTIKYYDVAERLYFQKFKINDSGLFEADRPQLLKNY